MRRDLAGLPRAPTSMGTSSTACMLGWFHKTAATSSYILLLRSFEVSQLGLEIIPHNFLQPENPVPTVFGVIRGPSRPCHIASPSITIRTLTLPSRSQLGLEIIPHNFLQPENPVPTVFGVIRGPSRPCHIASPSITIRSLTLPSRSQLGLEILPHDFLPPANPVTTVSSVVRHDPVISHPPRSQLGV